MTPLITIIIPVYNVEKYIKKCIDSVITQTCSQIEIILVDDGSTDLSGDICDLYEKKDRRIKVVHKKNGGLSDARNAGLDISSGEYIVFLDSDDFISEYFIEIVVDVLEKEAADLVVLESSVSFYDGDIVPLAASQHDYEYSNINTKKALELMLYQRIATGAQFKICRRSLYKNIRFPKGYLYEDVATTYKLFFVAIKVCLIRAKLYAYRERKSSITHQKFNARSYMALKVHDQLINDSDIVNAGLSAAAVSRVFQMVFNIFLRIPISDREAMKSFWEYIKNDRLTILKDDNNNIKKKNKAGALLSFLGMYPTHIIGNVLLYVRKGN